MNSANFLSSPTFTNREHFEIEVHLIKTRIVAKLRNNNHQQRDDSHTNKIIFCYSLLITYFLTLAIASSFPLLLLVDFIAVGRDKFILVAHDWGAVIGFEYVLKHMDTLEKYVMLGGPPFQVWQKSVFSTVKQFFMSWYIFYFQMPMLPELTMSLGDLQAFKTFDIESKEEIEAFKYTFGQEGALKPGIDYYRANCNFLFPSSPSPTPNTFVPGLFMLGEGDKYISRQSGDEAQKTYKNLEFKIIPGANHFCQQHKPEETNRFIREFLEKK